MVGAFNDSGCGLGQNRRTVGDHSGFGQDAAHDGHEEHNDLKERRTLSKEVLQDRGGLRRRTITHEFEHFDLGVWELLVLLTAGSASN